MRQGFKLLSINPAIVYARPSKPGPYKTFPMGTSRPYRYL
jgi:hypothetical protein